MKKRCACGRVYTRLPANAKHSSDDAFSGAFFDCECRSTLFVPARSLGMARTGTLLAFFTCLTLALLALYCARSAELFSGLGETKESAK